MKINISWGWGIVIALAVFIIFIMSFVLRMIFDEKYDHQLVSENYYKDELLFQLELDKLENAKKLPMDVDLKIENNNLMIFFPTDFDFNGIEGTVHFQYIIDKKYDFEFPIKLDSHSLIVDKTKLKKGRYNVKIDWKYQNKSYLLKEKISI